MGQRKHEVALVVERILDLAELRGLSRVVAAHALLQEETKFRPRHIAVLVQVRLATDATDEGGPEDAVGGHGLPRATSGDELAHGLGRHRPDLLWDHESALLEDAAGEAGVEEEERVLGLDLLGPREDLCHAQRLARETLAVLIGVGGVAGYEVAHLTTVQLLCVAVAGVVEEQAVLRIVAVLVNEVPEGCRQLPLGGVEDAHDVETLSFQCGADFLHVLGHAFQIRPTGGVVAHPDHERVALLVESDQFACLRLDLNALDATGFSG